MVMDAITESLNHVLGGNGCETTPQIGEKPRNRCHGDDRKTGYP